MTTTWRDLLSYLFAGISHLLITHSVSPQRPQNSQTPPLEAPNITACPGLYSTSNWFNSPPGGEQLSSAPL